MIKKEALITDALRILKIGTCPSLSGRSDLTYHIGCNTEDDIHFRVVANTGSGQFNADAISLHQITNLLAEHPAEKLLNSSVLVPVFRGKSSNSAAFLFATLKAELIVLPGSNKDAGYTIGDIEVFRREMNVLIASNASITNTAADKPAKKKPVGRKPSGIPTQRA